MSTPPAESFLAGLKSKPQFYYFVIVTTSHLGFLGVLGSLQQTMTFLVPELLPELAFYSCLLIGLVELGTCVSFLGLQQNASILFSLFLIINAVSGLIVTYWMNHAIFSVFKFIWPFVFGLMIGRLKAHICLEMLPYVTTTRP
jgi:hypothetical protein